MDRQVVDIARPDGQDVTFAYELGTGRLDSVTLPATPGPGSEVRNYSYDATTGQLATLSGPDATLTFAYDGSLLTSEQWIDGPITSTVTHNYNDDFRLESLQVNSESALTFTYDGDGFLTGAGALTPITRHPDYGFVTATALGSVTDAWTYSPFGELESYDAQVGGSSQYAVEYTRDQLGRIETKTETIGGVTALYEYEYDPAGRLYRVKQNGMLVSEYTYDSNGNRTGGFTPLAGTILSTTYDDQDRLLEYVTTGGTTSYTYTENGELQSKTDASGTTTYAYDALGNLRSVELPGGGPQIEYLIDGRNRRIGKKVNGTIVTRWIYKDKLTPIAELDAEGGVLAQFVYGTKSNVPDYVIKYGLDAGTYRVISDHLGSPRLIINGSDGSIAQRIDYDEFGEASTTSTFQPFGFAGGLYDYNTHLVRFGVRDYDAATARWTSKEPLSFTGGGTNLYGYVINDPVNLKDISGLRPGDRYYDDDTAGEAAIKDINPTSIKENKEYAGRICQHPDGTYSYTPPSQGTENTSYPGVCPANTDNVGDYHTHGGNDPRYRHSEDYSDDDKQTNYDEGVPGYLGTPRGVIKKYDPDSGCVTTLGTGAK